MQQIGVVGLGLMGNAIVGRLRKAGFELIAYDVDSAKRARAAQPGVTPVDSLAAVGERCTTIMLAVFNTDQVEAVIDGLDGLLNVRAPAAPRLTFICTSTCDPDRIAELAGRVAARADYIEMPVSGTSAQVTAGEGVGLVAGDKSAVDAVTPVLHAVCPNRHYLGAVGNGAKAKLAVNLVLGLNRGAIAEGLVFAGKMGLDPVPFLEVLRNSAAYSQVMDTKGPLMARREFQKPASRVDQSYKDFSLMLDYSRGLGQQLPFAEVYTQLLCDCIEQGEAQWDNAAILAAIARRSDG
jgi:3-hydroxyisobutyrate dehydrogenase-like beta-hydroxyacid dehydrogenase